MALYLLGAVACTSSSERRGAVEAFDGPSPTGRALQTWPWLYKLKKLDNFFPPRSPPWGSEPWTSAVPSTWEEAESPWQGWEDLGGATQEVLDEPIVDEPESPRQEREDLEAAPIVDDPAVPSTGEDSESPRQGREADAADGLNLQEVLDELTRANVTLVPDPSSPGHYVALLPESTRALNLTLPEWVDVECRGEGCEVVEDGGGSRRLLETSPVQVRLGCGPTALDATDGSTSITITLQGLEDCDRSTPAGAVEEPGELTPNVTTAQAPVGDGGDPVEEPGERGGEAVDPGGDGEPEVEPGLPGGAVEEPGELAPNVTTAQAPVGDGGDPVEEPGEPGGEAVTTVAQDPGGNGDSDVLRAKIEPGEDGGDPVENVRTATAQAPGGDGGNPVEEPGEPGVQVVVVATAAAAAGAVVVGVAATVVVALRRKRRRRSVAMAEGVELDSKLSANSSVLQHLGDGDASGAQDDDDDDGGGDPEVIISNPGRGGDVAVATALEVDRKGKRKLSPEEAAILTRLTRLIDDDDVD